MEWLSFFMAPAVAAIQVGVGYALVKPACAARGPAMLITLSAVTFLVAVIGAAIGWSYRDRFIGAVSTGLNVLTMILVVCSTIPHFMLNVCD